MEIWYSQCSSHPATAKVGVVGHTEQLQANSRDLSWDAFAAATIRVGTVTDAMTNSAVDGSGCLATHDIMMDFGSKLGTHVVQAVLHKDMFSSGSDLLDKQVIAVTNLVDESSDTARMAVLSAGGKALLQPAKPVANGYLLA